MSVRSFSRRCVALDQLEVALKLWEEGDQDFSVITLAGAAEEILGKCLTAEGKANEIDDSKASFARMYEQLYGEKPGPKDLIKRANSARNALKHYDLGSSPIISMDAHEEARDMLNRAIDNYWRLTESLTPAMREFDKTQRETGSS